MHSFLHTYKYRDVEENVKNIYVNIYVYLMKF